MKAAAVPKKESDKQAATMAMAGIHVGPQQISRPTQDGKLEKKIVPYEKYKHCVECSIMQVRF